MIYTNNIKSFIVLSRWVFVAVLLLRVNSSAGIELCFFDSAAVSDTIIRLEDVAGVCAGTQIPKGLLQTRIGSSAPAGYSRFISPEDVITYNISKRYPELSISARTAHRVKIRTRYKIVHVNDFKKDIATYIENNVHWKKGTYTLSIKNGPDSLKCYPQEHSVRIDGLKTPYPKGDFKVKLLISQGKNKTWTEVVCRLDVRAPVLVASEQISRWDDIGSHNCRIELKDITRCGFRPILSWEQCRGMRAIRTISAGRMISDKYMEKKPVIERGDQVAIVAQKGTVRIIASGLAKESGGIGEKIWVQNLNSLKLIRTEIAGSGEVKTF